MLSLDVRLAFVLFISQLRVSSDSDRGTRALCHNQALLDKTKSAPGELPPDPGRECVASVRLQRPGRTEELGRDPGTGHHPRKYAVTKSYLTRCGWPTPSYLGLARWLMRSPRSTMRTSRKSTPASVACPSMTRWPTSSRSRAQAPRQVPAPPSGGEDRDYVRRPELNLRSICGNDPLGPCVDAAKNGGS